MSLRKLSLAFMMIVLFCGRAVAQQEPSATVVILSPEPGQALKGSVPIQAQVSTSDIESLELTFAYEGDRTNTWFLLAEITAPWDEEKYVNWDTTILTDGDYVLRLVLTHSDGLQETATAPGLRVRNYSPVETNTPSPSETPLPQETVVPTQTLTPTATPVPPTGTPLPSNPALVSPGDITDNLGRGALAAAAVFMVIGIYGSIRHLFRR
jgi:hypothetical protein